MYMETTNEYSNEYLLAYHAEIRRLHGNLLFNLNYMISHVEAFRMAVEMASMDGWVYPIGYGSSPLSFQLR